MSARPAPAVAGRALRRIVPRSRHAEWAPAPDRTDPVAVLEAEGASRVPELLPIRHARMATSAFAFFRGSAGLMAADLATTPTTGLHVQLCGDAHLSNFGAFASPERHLLFDLNDFDETFPGPWEWDVKRLAASTVIAGRDRGMGAKECRRLARRTVRQYREAMRRFATMSPLDTWYARLDEADLRAVLASQLNADQLRRVERDAARARAKDSTRAFAKLVSHGPGGARIAADPPLIIPIEDVVGDEAEGWDLTQAMIDLLASTYRDTLPPERRVLFDRYEYVHAARKVVGVGSVGTRAWVFLLLGREHGEPLFLQAKEAGPSVLEAHLGGASHENHGRRVVEGQRLMQAASDILLGWVTAKGVDGLTRDFYIRQLWDWKASADLGRLKPAGMEAYARLCAWTLARAHARTGDAVSIGAYLGSGTVFDRALAAFADAYADQNERDHRALLDAIADGRIVAEQPAGA